MENKKASLDEMKQEAILRMTMLGLWKPCIRKFAKKEPTIEFSEGMGALYDIDENTDPKMLPVIREFEKKTGSLVYHVIHGVYEFGDCLTMLYVGPDKKQWKSERPEKGGYIEAYVANLSNLDFSEDGTVRVAPCFGGLVRKE